MRGVFLDLETYKPDDRHPALLEPTLEQWDFFDGTPTPEEAIERMQGADVVVINKVKMTREIMQACPDLKLIVAGATGVDNIDIVAAEELGIPVSNVRGYSTESVAQVAFSLMLALSNNLIQYHNLVQDGAWQRTVGFNLLDFDWYELHSKTLGIVGYGDIGQAVARIGAAFGMDIIVADRKGADELRDGRMAFDDVITQADILTIHCPKTAETTGLIGKAELAAMKKTALLINVSRGGIVDEAALMAALDDGEIAGAGLDVLSQEPPRDGNPLLDDGEKPNLIITPHCAWASVEARVRMFEQIAEIITAFKAGQPMNRMF